MTAARSAPLTVRLTRTDKDAFAAAAADAGLEPSVAARQVLELIVKRMRAMPSPDFIVVLAEVNAALKEEEPVV